MRENSTKQLAPGSADERPELLRALGEQYTERTRDIRNYSLGWFATSRLFRRLGVDPSSRQGDVVGALLWMAFMLGLPLIITAVTGQWALAEIERWALVAVSTGIVTVAVHPLYYEAIGDRVSLHRTMADESGLRRLMAWDRRWYSVRAMVAGAGAFAVATLVVLFFIQRPTSMAPIPAGTIVIGAILLYWAGECTYGIFMWAVESRILVAHRYELYRLSPIDSVAVQRSIRGYNGIALLNSLLATVFIIEFLILLPARPTLIAQIALILLVVTYLGVGFGVLLPRLAIGRII